jgi:zinc transporter 2
MQAAVIHIIGDIVQSIGVVIAGLLIWLQPFDVGEHCNENGECLTNWVYADPVCTLLFTVLVIWTTIGTVRNIVSQVMMDVPDSIDPESLKRSLKAVKGVVGVHDLHVWTVGQGSFITAHVTIGKDFAQESMRVLNDLIKMTQSKFNIGHATFQIEVEGQFDRSIEHLRLGAHTCQSFTET